MLGLGLGLGLTQPTTAVAPPVVDPPVIDSALTATATTGVAFSYQITATNTPTAFNATGLPDGLSINTTTGEITGTPTTGAVTNITISATNAGGTGSNTLVLTTFNALLVDAAFGGTGTNLGGVPSTAYPSALTRLNAGDYASAITVLVLSEADGTATVGPWGWFSDGGGFEWVESGTLVDDNDFRGAGYAGASSAGAFATNTSGTLQGTPTTPGAGTYTEFYSGAQILLWPRLLTSEEIATAAGLVGV